MKSGINTKIASARPNIGFLLIAASFAAKHLGVSMTACCFISGVGCAWAIRRYSFAPHIRNVVLADDLLYLFIMFP